MHQSGSLWVPQTPKNHDAIIEVFKFIRNKLHFCTNIEYEMLKIITLRFVNLFVEVSRVCAMPRQGQLSQEQSRAKCYIMIKNTGKSCFREFSSFKSIKITQFDLILIRAISSQVLHYNESKLQAYLHLRNFYLSKKSLNHPIDLILQ